MKAVYILKGHLESLLESGKCFVGRNLQIIVTGHGGGEFGVWHAVRCNFANHRQRRVKRAETTNGKSRRSSDKLEKLSSLFLVKRIQHVDQPVDLYRVMSVTVVGSNARLQRRARPRIVRILRISAKKAPPFPRTRIWTNDRC